MPPRVRAGLLLALVGVLAAGPASAQTTAQPQAPVFHGGVDLVTVDLTIVDSDGTPVVGLSTADVDVLVDGTPRKIVSWVAVPSAAGAERGPSGEPSSRTVIYRRSIDNGPWRGHAGAARRRAVRRSHAALGPARTGRAAVLGNGGPFRRIEKHAEGPPAPWRWKRYRQCAAGWPARAADRVHVQRACGDRRSQASDPDSGVERSGRRPTAA